MLKSNQSKMQLLSSDYILDYIFKFKAYHFHVALHTHLAFEELFNVLTVGF